MDLNIIWQHFINELNSLPSISKACYKKSAGIPFLYIYTSDPVDEILLEIQRSSSMVMKGKQLHCETTFVRQESILFVFRHRFFVPQRKMFCCGNLCPDCIRYTDQS